MLEHPGSSSPQPGEVAEPLVPVIEVKEDEPKPAEPAEQTTSLPSSTSLPMPTGGAEPLTQADAASSAAPLTTSDSSRLDRAQGAVRRALSEGAGERDAKRRAFAPLTLGGKSIDVMLAEQDTCIHPLLRAVKEAQEDVVNGKHNLEDHGTWDGRWPMLSRGEYETLESAGWTLPTGGATAGHEILQTGAHKEFQWKNVNEGDREKFREAAKDQWSKWLENGAVEILTLEESRRILKDLERKGEMERVLKPRFVLTDKNAAHRTSDCQLPLKAWARLIVPGFKDLENLRGELRRDAPTGSRAAQHVLFSLAACHPQWLLRAADVRAAFLKGDKYVKRVLYMTGTDGSRGPSIPVPNGCLCRVLKGIFGLADAPREWYLRLDKEMRNQGWITSVLDGALWYFKKEQVEEGSSPLRGVVVGHVDDLLFAGDEVALKSLLKLGEILGFGSLQEEDFVWCGKRIHREKDTKEMVVSMKTYHAQLKPTVVPRSRRQELESVLTPGELKQLRRILGSLQWLTAQIRFDLAFAVSSMQSEKPSVSTLLKANKTLVEAKRDEDFELRFRNVNYMTSGIMMVSDAALGNVDEQGRNTGTPEEKVHSQSCYIVMLADGELMNGRKGRFNTLDFRSHRLARVCRSSYAAETMGAEEGFDAAELLRGFIAEARGIPVHGKDAYIQVTRVPLLGVTDAKDTYDRFTSDTGFGTQKSLMFTIANMRQSLRRPNTGFRWTATSNMFVDAGTKLMDNAHLKDTLKRGEWCVTYSPDFVKQTTRKKKDVPAELYPDGELPGRAAVAEDRELLQWARHFSESPGWHFVDGVGIHVANGAMSLRSPNPRFAINDYPLRTVVGEFHDPKGLPTWRILEERADLREMSNLQEKLLRRAHRLLSFYQVGSKAKENKSDEKTVIDPW